ncbi:MAG TPA: hypothetical protein VG406_10745 [Isosphaeraceae bacterium]|nr:hypothetical protein [Isosphaeraceae bacterium]
MRRLRGGIVGLAMALVILAAQPGRARAQFMGGFGGYGMGYPGYGYGFGGFGFPMYGYGGLGYGGLGYGGLGYGGFGYGGFGYGGYGLGSNFGTPAFGFYGAVPPTFLYGGFGNPGYFGYGYANMGLTTGLTPLAMQSAAAEQALFGTAGLSRAYPARVATYRIEVVPAPASGRSTTGQAPAK